jgi:hypothetical protein
MRRRAVKIDYDFNYGLPELKARINMKADMLISNYGKQHRLIRLN